jgi:glutathione S-transferase
MKLYFAPGACSLATHIALTETAMTYELEQVNLKNKTCFSGDFTKINWKGCVPAIVMNNGEVLTECTTTMQYIAETKGDTNFYPKAGTTERYKTNEWMNFIATEIHKTFGSLFIKNGLFEKNPEAMTEYKHFITENITAKFNSISEKLGKNDYLVGKNFTIADAYLFTIMSWGKYLNFDFSKWANLTAYQNRIYQRPSVQKALKEEGLLN